ncbi:MAG: hypothetical protein E6J60_05685 [Deltaproteobacteria bacterium]|nr:MAG: hypothetical protein E6J60_05685 [Deltaproteobacteria bacterium]
MALPEAQAEPVVQEGVCYALFAYDAGLAIDLDESERRITALTQRAAIRHKHRAPRYFEYRPAPLRVTQEREALAVGAFRTAPSVEAVLYDFGAVSVTYQVPLAGPLAHLITLAEELYESAVLLADSRRWVEQLLATIAPAVTRPGLTDFVETYVIFEVGAFSPPCPPAELYTTHAQEVARILRSERAVLSNQEVNDALGHRISFGSEDVAVIDWDAALIADRDADDVRAVLEFANVELLEMRYLDQQLDDALDESYDTLSRRDGLWLPGVTRADLRRIGQLQVDNAVLFEGVNNALKLLGDQYLARVYRLVSERFHLAEWDASILRKLQTLESIYQKLSDQSANRRTEALEWIIIALIAAEILIPFVPGLVGLR